MLLDAETALKLVQDANNKLLDLPATLLAIISDYAPGLMTVTRNDITHMITSSPHYRDLASRSEFLVIGGEGLWQYKDHLYIYCQIRGKRGGYSNRDITVLKYDLNLKYIEAVDLEDRFDQEGDIEYNGKYVYYTNDDGLIKYDIIAKTRQMFDCTGTHIEVNRKGYVYVYHADVGLHFIVNTNKERDITEFEDININMEVRLLDDYLIYYNNENKMVIYFLSNKSKHILDIEYEANYGDLCIHNIFNQPMPEDCDKMVDANKLIETKDVMKSCVDMNYNIENRILWQDDNVIYYTLGSDMYQYNYNTGVNRLYLPNVNFDAYVIYFKSIL